MSWTVEQPGINRSLEQWAHSFDLGQPRTALVLTKHALYLKSY
jgi:hypothetical protein